MILQFELPSLLSLQRLYWFYNQMYFPDQLSLLSSLW
jgi:hypothetical protein